MIPNRLAGDVDAKDDFEVEVKLLEEEEEDEMEVVWSVDVLDLLALGK